MRFVNYSLFNLETSLLFCLFWEHTALDDKHSRKKVWSQLETDLAGKAKCSAVFAGQISLETISVSLPLRSYWASAVHRNGLAVAERQQFLSAHYLLEMEMREGMSIFPTVLASQFQLIYLWPKDSVFALIICVHRNHSWAIYFPLNFTLALQKTNWVNDKKAGRWRLGWGEKKGKRRVFCPAG